MKAFFRPHSRADKEERPERGSTIDCEPEEVLRTTTILQAPFLRSCDHGFRVVQDEQALRTRRGGDYYDQAEWVGKNASTAHPFVGQSGVPGIRLARDFTEK